jgi:hypothetical protein
LTSLGNRTSADVRVAVKLDDHDHDTVAAADRPEIVVHARIA